MVNLLKDKNIDQLVYPAGGSDMSWHAPDVDADSELTLNFGGVPFTFDLDKLEAELDPAQS